MTINEAGHDDMQVWTQRVKELRDRTVAEVGRVVVGMERVTQQFLIALLAGGHVLLEGVPGVAKTTLSKMFAQILGIHFQRLQFTPDLLPSDVTGTYIFDRKTNEFVLRKGPIFCQVLLADEVNRAPAKTQSSLLEAMQENQVTIEGTTLPLPRPFMVLATQNPVEHEGVYRLPEAQLDRFLLRIEMGYPGAQHEAAMLRLHSLPVVPVQQLFSAELILEVQEKLNSVYGKDELMTYIVDLAEASRQHPDVALGASPRASLCLLRARGHGPCLRADRISRTRTCNTSPWRCWGIASSCRPEAEIEGKNVKRIVRDLIESVPVLGQ